MLSGSEFVLDLIENRITTASNCCSYCGQSDTVRLYYNSECNIELSRDSIVSIIRNKELIKGISVGDMKCGDLIRINDTTSLGLDNTTIDRMDGLVLGLMHISWEDNLKYKITIKLRLMDGNLCREVENYLIDKRYGITKICLDGIMLIEVFNKDDLNTIEREYGLLDNINIPTSIKKGGDGFILGYLDGFFYSGIFDSGRLNFNSTYLNKFMSVSKLLLFYGVISNIYLIMHNDNSWMYRFYISMSQIKKLSKLIRVFSNRILEEVCIGKSVDRKNNYIVIKNIKYGNSMSDVYSIDNKYIKCVFK